MQDKRIYWGSTLTSLDSDRLVFSTIRHMATIDGLIEALYKIIDFVRLKTNRRLIKISIKKQIDYNSVEVYEMPHYDPSPTLQEQRHCLSLFSLLVAIANQLMLFFTEGFAKCWMQYF